VRLHDLGVVHRDLKLENILIDDTVNPPKPFLIDFGLSKVFMTEQYSTDPYGTLAYCSPEIVLRQ
jgi:serine/threonine protein kinase